MNNITLPKSVLKDLSCNELMMLAKMVMGCSIDTNEKLHDSSYQTGYWCGWQGHEREYGLMDRKIFDLGYEDGIGDKAAGRECAHPAGA